MRGGAEGAVGSRPRAFVHLRPAGSLAPSRLRARRGMAGYPHDLESTECFSPNLIRRWHELDGIDSYQ